MNGCMEFGYVSGDDNAPLREAFHRGSDARLDDQLGNDQDWERDEKTNVSLDVV